MMLDLGSSTVRILFGVVVAVLFSGCPSGASCGGDTNDTLILPDGGTASANDDDDDGTTALRQACMAICSVSNLLDDGLRETCDCPFQACVEPTDTYHAPGDTTCSTFSDPCGVPLDWARCVDCAIDGAADMDAFESYTYSTFEPDRLDYLCICDGDTGHFGCEPLPVGCEDNGGNLYVGVGTHTLSNGCTTCHCDGYEFAECESENCAACLLDDGTVLEHGQRESFEDNEWCVCGNGELSCRTGCGLDIAPGNTFPGGSGCDVCTCHGDNEISCVDTCEF